MTWGQDIEDRGCVLANGIASMRPRGKKDFPSICSGKEELRPCKVTIATR